MPTTPLNTILSWFETGDFPTQDQFAASWSSFYHKDESIPMDKVENLNTKLQEKTDKSVYEAHLTNTDAHTTTLAKLDASNLNDVNIQAWKTILDVGELPPNIALIDDIPNTLQGNVWTKEQSDALYMLLEDFVLNGKIRADKIEALGLTELISVTETSLSAFMTNNANYTYEKNDFIAIPDGNGNYSLYIYKGGTKTTAGNYITTGLSNITIAMVQGLQAALDTKMNKPTGNGNYFINQTGTATTYKNINPAANYLLFWNNTDFTVSDIYNNSGKYGIGTTTPSEMLHLNNGRLRSKAIVFEENTESLPNQITLANRRFYGSDLTGSKRMLMYRDYDDYLALIQSLSQTQKETLGTAWNNQYSNGLLNVYSITPTVMKNDHVVRYLVLQGINLNVNPLNTSVKFIPVGNAIGTGEIDCLGFQTSANGQTLIVSVYGDSLPSGVQYNIVIRTSTPTTQTHRTTSSINVVSQIDNIDLSALTWDLKSYTTGQESVFNMNSALIAYTSSPANKPYAFEPNTIVAAAKSSIMFGINTNFYLEINFSVSNSGTNGSNDVNDFYGYLGLLQNSIPNVLADNTFLKMIFAGFRSGGYQSLIFWNNILSNDYRIVPQSTMISGNIVIMRQGNIYSQFITVAGQTIVVSTTGTVEAVSLALSVTNGTTQKTFNGSIVQAFTF